MGYVFILIDAMRNDPSDSQSNANKVKMMKILRHEPERHTSAALLRFAMRG